MSAAAAEKRRWTYAEYLEMERASDEKHEFFDGEIYAMTGPAAMAGASYEHNQITIRLIGALLAAVKGKCEVFSSDMRIHTAADSDEGQGFYPDAILLCGPPKFHDDKRDVIENPDVIFEVLSPSTERFDRGDKFASYRALPSLHDYVLVSQTRVCVEHFSRGEVGRWIINDTLGPGQILTLPCGEIAVDDLYRGVLPAVVRPA